MVIIYYIINNFLLTNYFINCLFESVMFSILIKGNIFYLEHYNSARRKESYEMRKISKTNKNKDFGSVMSLDWDFDGKKVNFSFD